MATVAGGRHALMGTHNRLMALGEETYLEIIAIDPEAPPPARPRWFALDAPAMRRAWTRGPALVHWVARTDDIDAARRPLRELVGEVLALSRGDYRWRIGVPADGSLPAGGAFPDADPVGRRAPSGDRPAGIGLPPRPSRAPPPPGAATSRPRCARWAWPKARRWAWCRARRSGLSAVLRSPRGMVLLPESPDPE